MQPRERWNPAVLHERAMRVAREPVRPRKIPERVGARLKPLPDGCLAQGMSRRAIVSYLNGMGVRAPKGGSWSPRQVQRGISYASM